MAKKTPLYEMHLQYKGKMVEFAGFDMPIQYAGITTEHEAVRTSTGVFDVSHMGKFTVEGEQAEAFLNRCVTNDITRLMDGQVQYSPMCYDNGTTVDDILVYKHDRERYLLVVNAVNMEKDWEWLNSHLPQHVSMKDITDSLAQIAIQGPGAENLLQHFTYEVLSSMEYYWFRDDVLLLGTNMLVSRTGYTGEDGFELYFPKEEAGRIWKELIEAGAEPCGLGCRDTLRFEAGMPLYGDELSDRITPLEAGLGYFVKLDKKDGFIGRDALVEQAKTSHRKLIGFEVLDKGISRHGELVLDTDGKELGFVTTGYKSPSLGKTLGMAIIDGNHKDENIFVTMRNKKLKARVIPRRFYKKEA